MQIKDAFNRWKRISVVAIILISLTSALNARPAMVIEGLSPEAFQQTIERHRGDPDVVLIDIRTPREFSAGHIQGARLIDYYGKNYIDHLKALDRQKTYLIYCRSGNRTGRSLALFKRLGFTRIYHLESGLIGWVRQKYPLVAASDA